MAILENVWSYSEHDRHADYMLRNSQNWVTQTEILLVSFLMDFIIHITVAPSKDWILPRLFSNKISRGRGADFLRSTALRASTSLLYFISYIIPLLPYIKTIKFTHARHLHWPQVLHSEGLVSNILWKQ